MSRREGTAPRDPPGPQVHGQRTSPSFINVVMKSGKKSVAESIMYGAMDVIHKKTGKDAVELVQKALGNVARWSK
jgi:small subunit ribosomal protein S7